MGSTTPTQYHHWNLLNKFWLLITYGISAFISNDLYTYIAFGTDVFSIRKNVRKWIESQMERFVPIFCFEVKIYKYSTKEIS